MGLGVGEMLLILFVVLLVFGAGRLPQLGQSLGKALNNFKKAATTNEIDVTPQPPPQVQSGQNQKKDPQA
jgi:sec-independent protein translocase protein TatA